MLSMIDDPSQKQTVPYPAFTVPAGETILQTVGLGRPLFFSEQSIEVDAETQAQASNLVSIGRTAILVAKAKTVIGMLVLEDILRPVALTVIARLKKLGIRTVLITGDNTVTAERIAGELGIGEVHAEVLPAQKVEIVKQFQAEGRVVAFVGNGVNDGPALATANVGVAMGLAQGKRNDQRNRLVPPRVSRGGTNICWKKQDGWNNDEVSIQRCTKGDSMGSRHWSGARTDTSA